jgi:hypothetical protein
MKADVGERDFVGLDQGHRISDAIEQLDERE